jgi:hypothetical protein
VILQQQLNQQPVEEQIVAFKDEKVRNAVSARFLVNVIEEGLIQVLHRNPRGGTGTKLVK